MMNMKKNMAAVLCGALMAGTIGVTAFAADVNHMSVLTGTVATVVPVGTQVKVGDTLVTVQTIAGPMAACRATVDGVVTKVDVQSGSEVTNGEVCVVVDSNEK